jgi:electron transport complex protein RnfC
LKYTFRRGIHPEDNKKLSESCPFEEMPTGSKVYIPLSQHIGAPCTACVEPGAMVKAGTLIGLSNGYVSANVHSSVSGKVLGFEMRENAQGRKLRHIVIENDGLYEEENLPPLENPTKEQIILRCKEAGIVGMGGATFPTHVKLEAKNKINIFIVNGSECEPYITTDYRMMLNFPKEIMEGIGYIKTALQANEVAIGIEANKPDAIAAMTKELTDPDTHVYELKTKYPQGGEKQLIYAITKMKVPDGGLPSEVGAVVLNISTVYALWQAVKLGKPCYSRYMTVSGEGIKRPCNLHVRIGVPLSEITEYLGVNEGYVKAVFGGPMMGFSLASFKPVTSKGSSALLLLSKKEIRPIEPTPCINCGRCASVCPMNLMPMMTDRLILKDMIAEAKKFNPMSCIECGCCAYVCPAKRPLVQSQRLAKKLIRERKI